MKYSKIMAERIRRVEVLFKELGYTILDTERSAESYSAGFENSEGLQGGFFIDRASRFLEIAYSFSFSLSMYEFFKVRLEKMLKTTYEYGCYSNVQLNRRDISFSVFAKIYYSGLNYYSLKDNLRDFQECIKSLTEVLEIIEKEI
ncbi:MAG: hypothetical protein GH155_00275 [Spirochaeta sp.]|nr:hypothetical protein [Spirochaeta sp.]